MWILLVWLTVSSQVSITFDLCFISNLQVSTRYHLGLPLAQWFHNTWLLGWRFGNHTFVWMKRGHLNSHEGLLYPITGSSMLVTVNWAPWLFYNNRRTLACYLVHKQSLFSHPVLVRLQSFEQVECSWAFALEFSQLWTKRRKLMPIAKWLVLCCLKCSMFSLKLLCPTYWNWLLGDHDYFLSCTNPPPCDCQSFARQLGLQGTGPFASPVTGNISDIGLFPEPSDICLFPELSGTSQHPSNKLHCLFSVQNQFGPPLDPSKPNNLCMNFVGPDFCSTLSGDHNQIISQHQDMGIRCNVVQIRPHS